MTCLEGLMSANVTAVFNERDHGLRRAAIESTYTADALAHGAEGSSSGWDGVDQLGMTAPMQLVGVARSRRR